MTLTTPADTPPREGRRPALGLRPDVRNLSLLGVLAVLVHAVATGTAPAPSFADGLQVQRVLAAVEESARNAAVYTPVLPAPSVSPVSR
ncbi:hypothetical protein ACFUT3_27570 [Streptomyces cinereoruber]|uniref:hypothetical protein n=1 Tax=Streptomyces cinereoruber TaxID=67260 RepID=UPI0036452565